jgi:uncharacterized protein (DUF1800 family)
MHHATRAPRRPAGWIAFLIFGTVVSAASCVHAIAASSELVNISVRARASEGDGALIAGFVVHGAGERPLLVRAVGPTLAAPPYGVGGVLADPSVSLFRNDSLVRENRSWSTEADMPSLFARLGAFDLLAGSRDAALLHRTTEGVYTAVARSSSGGEGEVLLEVYDARLPAAPGPAISNLSLRAALQPAATMVTGFVVAGPSPKRLLVRAVGPSLSRFGVTGFLPNPRIRLFTESSDVALNDDWSASPDAAAIAEAAHELGAFALTRDSRDAAILTTLQPGAYTLHVTDAAVDATGVVLVELYDADPRLAEPTAPPPAAQPDRPSVSIRAHAPSASEASDAGEFRVSRTGPTDTALVVTLAWSGSATAGADYTPLPTSVTIPVGETDVALVVTALPDTFFEAPEAVIGTVSPDSGYNVLAPGQAGIRIMDAPYSGATGWIAEFFNNTSLSGDPVLVRTDAAIDFDWQSERPAPEVRPDNFSARWTGVLVPPMTADYTFIVSGDDIVRLWIDDILVLDRPYTWRETAIVLPLAGGVPHLVRFEFVERWGNASARLSWAGGGMGRRIITEAVPRSSVAPTPVSLDREIAIVGESFVARVSTAGTATSYSAASLPPGLHFNPHSGVISGIPTTAGDYDVWLEASGGGGSAAGTFRLRVLAPGGHVLREVLAPAEGAEGPLELSGDAVVESSAPVYAVESLAASTGAHQRIRGYITAPTTGLHRFWLSASGPAAFYFSDSDQPGDKVLRARVRNPTNVRAWSQAEEQRSPVLHLTAGARYYFEVVHQTSGTGDHVSLGWIRPGQTGALPFEVVPGYVLSPYDESAALADGSAVFLATLRPVGVIPSGGFGAAAIVLSPDQTRATVSLRFGGLTSAPTAIYVFHGGPQAGPGSPVRGLPRSSFDGLQWTLNHVAGLTPADLVEAMRTGELFLLVQTEDHPTGELRGQFGPALGSSAFRLPSPAPEAALDSLDDPSAARFLAQATYGATLPEIARLRTLGIEAWIQEQRTVPQTRLLPYIRAVREARQRENPDAGVWTDVLTEAWWQAAVAGPDQLRQRVAFALSEILVVSSDSNLGGEIDGLAVYYDTLAAHAFGNFRDLLREVTLSPAMGVYLSMARNQKPDPAAGIYPDENYAREVMQLFSIGLNKLHPDGSLVLASNGLPIPTYDQTVITGLAHVFTGWSFASDDPEYNYVWGPPDFTRPMQHYGRYHDQGAKRLLDGEVLTPGLSGPQEIDYVVDVLFRHPNTGPFLARQLIQRLVTSNPSPGYIYRVARVFADDGTGTRGNLGAVVRAILTDFEARDPEVARQQGFGKLREPLVRIAHLWRAFNAVPRGGTYDFSWTRDRIGQEILQSPTVFNFFQPDYMAPGPTAEAGLVAPEFQIATDGNIAHLINILDWFVFRNADWTDDPVLDLLVESSLAADPDALLDRLDILLLGGAMSSELRARLRTVVTDLPRWHSATDRVRAVVFTLVTAPEYAVQK